jgi:hypothetical protein
VPIAESFAVAALAFGGVDLIVNKAGWSISKLDRRGSLRPRAPDPPPAGQVFATDTLQITHYGDRACSEVS